MKTLGLTDYLNIIKRPMDLGTVKVCIVLDNPNRNIQSNDLQHVKFEEEFAHQDCVSLIAA